MCASHQATRRHGWGNKTLAAAAVAIACGANVSGASAQLAAIPTGGTFDYQLHTRYAAADGVSIVSSDGDINADPAKPSNSNAPLDPSRFNICYVNVLQTQPDDRNFWIQNHKDLILGAGAVIDEEWPDEMLFDISTLKNQQDLLQLELPWIEKCRAAGFQAIEPDNIDSFQRSKGAFKAQEAAAFMKSFVAAAHNAGLLVGQKNVAEWTKPQADGSASLSTQVGFDFVVVEECKLTGECPQLVEHFGAERVFDIEYWYDTDYTVEGTSITVPAHTRDHFDQACQELAPGVRVVLRNRDVRPLGAEGYQFAACVAPTPAGPGTADSDTQTAEGQTGSEPVPETEPGPEMEPGTETTPGGGEENGGDRLPDDTDP